MHTWLRSTSVLLDADDLLATHFLFSQVTKADPCWHFRFRETCRKAV